MNLCDFYSDRFFAASGVQFVQHDRNQFHYRRAVFSSHLNSKIGNILPKAEALRITLNIEPHGRGGTGEGIRRLVLVTCMKFPFGCIREPYSGIDLAID